MSGPRTAEEFLDFAISIARPMVAAHEAAHGIGSCVAVVLDHDDPGGQLVLSMFDRPESSEPGFTGNATAIGVTPEDAWRIAVRVGVPPEDAAQFYAPPTGRFYVMSISHQRCLAATVVRQGDPPQQMH